MPSCYVVRETEIAESFRVQQIRGMFDYQNTVIRNEWNHTLPIEQNSWNIGLIVGHSGSGKTTMAQQMFDQYKIHEDFEWKYGVAVVDCFPEDANTKDIVSTLSAVGFSSPPHWLKPFDHLSTGQKFRVELARCLMEYKQGFVFDEFTSVVDRDVAKVGCLAISKLLRKRKEPPFVAVSCHYDIIDWLDPDWVYDVSTNRFEWRLERRKEKISLDVFKSDTSAWKAFSEHHYLDDNIHKGAECYIATWGNKPVGFCSVLHFPHASSKLFKREHRTVVLPDFQGVGIGNKLSETVASLYSERGYRFISATSAPSMIQHRKRSHLWRCTRFGRASRASKTDIIKQISNNRITASFEYIGK